MAFLGGDTQQMRDCADHLAQRSRQLSLHHDRLMWKVQSTIPAGWHGPDAQDFLAQARSTLIRMTTAVEGMYALSHDLTRQAAEQDDASNPMGPQIPGAVKDSKLALSTSLSAVVASKTKYEYGRWAPRDEKGRFQSPKKLSRWESARKATSDTNWVAKANHADDVAKWKSIGKWGGRLSTVVGAGFTAFDEWNSDPSLSTGEKIKNTAIKTTAATAGGWGGAWAGAQSGAMLGMVLGGPIGAAAGGVIGGAIGGVIGGMAGSKLGDGLKKLKFW